MQASNTPPDHPPGLHAPSGTRRAKSNESRIGFESRMDFSASGIPGGAFFMHFCAFWLLQKSNTRCNVNLMFAKSLFSEICTQKAHFAQLGPSLGASIGPEGAAVRVCRFTPRCQSRTGLKVEPKSKWHPMPESRMILREKNSGKVESGFYYALLFHDSGICPVFLTISHGYLFQEMVLEQG
jgi:hypothetical protein